MTNVAESLISDSGLSSNGYILKIVPTVKDFDPYDHYDDSLLVSFNPEWTYSGQKEMGSQISNMSWNQVQTNKYMVESVWAYEKGFKAYRKLTKGSAANGGRAGLQLKHMETFRVALNKASA